jgi:O-antigen biosynthesis protein WbqV
MNFKPEKLVIFDINENNPYELMNELNLSGSPGSDVAVCIGSVQDYRRLRQVKDETSPSGVPRRRLQARTAYGGKPRSGCHEQYYGTYNIVRCCETRTGVRKFVFISTTKPLTPTNVMGATKRISRAYRAGDGQASQTEFVAVVSATCWAPAAA